MIALHAVPWIEYERGWGCRPDGIQFFDSRERAESTIKEVMDKRDARNVPDEYSSPGDIIIMEVSQDLYDLVMKRGSFWSNMNTPSAAKSYVYDKRDDPDPRRSREELDAKLAEIFDSMSPKEARLAVNHVRVNRDAVLSYLNEVEDAQ